MDKQLAIQMLPVVNHEDTREALRGYVNMRIEQLAKQLETERDAYRVRGLQAAIAELRRFETLREEVLQASGKI